MRGSGAHLMRFSKLVAAFRNGSKFSATEASEYMKCDIETTRNQIKHLHDSGLLHISGYARKSYGYRYAIYAWAEPFGCPDVQRPVTNKGITWHPSTKSSSLATVEKTQRSDTPQAELQSAT
jgi:hypothetical protein